LSKPTSVHYRRRDDPAVLPGISAVSLRIKRKTLDEVLFFKLPLSTQVGALRQDTGRHRGSRFAEVSAPDESERGSENEQHEHRVHGPYEPEAGHRFNPAKLLMDPYAKAFTGRIEWSDAMFGYRVGDPAADLSRDDRNNASSMPKGVVIEQAFSWGDDRPLRT